MSRATEYGWQSRQLICQFQETKNGVELPRCGRQKKAIRGLLLCLTCDHDVVTQIWNRKSTPGTAS